jgi:hypothetical protein
MMLVGCGVILDITVILERKQLLEGETPPNGAKNE